MNFRFPFPKELKEIDSSPYLHKGKRGDQARAFQYHYTVNALINTIFQQTLFELGEQPVSLLWICQLLIALLAVGIVTRLIKNFLKYRLLAKFGIDGGNKEAIATLVSFGLGTFGYLIVLQATGIDLSSLAVIIGGLGVGIGFGLQDITKNLLSGLTVLVERKLRVGDFVEFDNIAGHIEEISIRSTVIRTLEGGEVIIPNAQLAEERITNWNYQDLKGRLEIDVGVAYGTDPVLVTETLLEAAYSQASVLRDPPPKVIFAGFGDSSLNFKLWFWIEHVDRRIPIKSELTFAVEYYLRQRGITIPFPQLDLWMRSPHASSEKSNLEDALSLSQLSAPADPADVDQPTKIQHGETLRARLSQISYFQSFDELQIRNLIEMGFRLQVEKSSIVARQGTTARAFYIVLSGTIGAFFENGEREQPMINFEAGQYFGELPLMLGVPYPTTLKAITDAVLFVINQTSFETLLQDYPALAEDIAQELAHRKEILQSHPDVWQAMMMNSETDNGAIVWIRRRLKDLFISSV